MSRWQKRLDWGRLIVGDDDRVLDCKVTPEQADRYVAGELDYCPGCMMLQKHFEGLFCGYCEEA